MVTIVEEFEALLKQQEADWQDAISEARKLMLEGVHALLQEFTQPVPAPVRDIRQHRGSTPARTKAVTGHAPPTTTNARQRAPPPPSSCQHSHTQGVTHKRATQPLRLAHTMTPESTQQQRRQSNGTKGTPPYHRPPGSKAWRCTQEHGADRPTPNHTCRHHQRPRRAATTTTAIGGRPGHTPLPPSAKDGPGIAQKSATLTLWSDQAATHQRPRCRATTTTSVTGQHQGYPPCHRPLGPKAQCCAQEHGVDRPAPNCTCRNHQCLPWCATATTIWGSQRHPPQPPSTGLQHPGIEHKRTTSIM